MTETPCIMPEQPYCPACPFGHITPDNDDQAFPDVLFGNCHWDCLCTQKAYEEWAQRYRKDDVQT